VPVYPRSARLGGTVREWLKEQGKLVRKQTIVHSYPFCYRTKKPLIYRALSCWFVDVQKIKQTMLDANAQINWVPDHLKYGRFGKWLEGARDWAISRNRYWGNPIPVWKSDASDYYEVIGSREELERKSGVKVDDLHKHFVDEITWPSPDGNGTMRRIPDVLDCWFESGSMPYAQNHYPFENKAYFEQNFPADFICEGLDQTRGWFYTLTIIAAGLFEKPAFYNVITNGLVLASDGKKMSKSLRNYSDPMEVVNTFGADALRFFLMNSAVVRAEDLRFSDEGVKEVLKSFIIPLWNAYSFFVTYANIDAYDPAEELGEGWTGELENPLDRWILSETEQIVREVSEALDSYELQRACQPLLNFVDLLNNWYIRRSRRRFWRSVNDTDKTQAYNTLYSVLLKFCTLAAPIIPFTAEEIYRNLKREGMCESVHLCSYPEYAEQLRDRELEFKMGLTKRTVTMGRALRSMHGLKTRQPLKTLYIVNRQESELAVLREMEPIIIQELNVKQVQYRTDESDLVEYRAKANFKVLGKKLGRYMKEAAAMIENLRSDEIAAVLDGRAYEAVYSGGSLLIDEEAVVVQRNEREGMKVLNEGGLTVGLDTRIFPELVQEGLARDIVRSVQNLRKERGLEVTDRIELALTGPAPVSEAVPLSRETSDHHLRQSAGSLIS